MPCPCFLKLCHLGLLFPLNQVFVACSCKFFIRRFTPSTWISVNNPLVARIRTYWSMCWWRVVHSSCRRVALFTTVLETYLFSFPKICVVFFCRQIIATLLGNGQRLSFTLLMSCYQSGAVTELVDVSGWKAEEDAVQQNPCYGLLPQESTETVVRMYASIQTGEMSEILKRFSI